MADYISTDIREAVMELARRVRADKRYQAFLETADAYTKDPDIERLVTEFNVQQEALTAEYAKPDKDQLLIDEIQKRINDLYDQVTANANYANYIRAKDESDAFVKAVLGEFEFFLTGQRPCSHDCASCASNCGSAQ